MRKETNPFRHDTKKREEKINIVNNVDNNLVKFQISVDANADGKMWVKSTCMEVSEGKTFNLKSEVRIENEIQFWSFLDDEIFKSCDFRRSLQVTATF